jgi:hypothetical protein
MNSNPTELSSQFARSTKSARVRATTGSRKSRQKSSGTSSWPRNKSTIEDKVADGLVLLEKFVERFKAAHVNAEAGGRRLLKKPTRDKYLLHLDQKILPKETADLAGNADY